MLISWLVLVITRTRTLGQIGRKIFFLMGECFISPELITQLLIAQLFTCFSELVQKAQLTFVSELLDPGQF